ncbi:hypothetical protein QLX08_008889 [Tetragonisca angustula]|uniref:Uncharacterized protein n=1 Tax=Tetragonisca angustula TaxID=166442 RepID=A0AAW0ZHU8_9HYME
MSSSAGTSCTDAEEDAEDVENEVAGSAQSSNYLPSGFRDSARDHLEGLRLDGSSIVVGPPAEDTSASPSTLSWSVPR